MDGLNKWYGDKDLVLVNVKYKLASLDRSRGDGYKKVEGLLQGVNEARATFKAVGAKADSFNDVSVVAQLVTKLSVSHQDRWHQDKTVTEFQNDQRKLGEKFLAWLERQGAAANSARLTQQALALSKQPLNAPPVPRCGACGKGGHKTESCEGGEGNGKPWGLGRDQGALLEQELA